MVVWVAAFDAVDFMVLLVCGFYTFSQEPLIVMLIRVKSSDNYLQQPTGGSAMSAADIPPKGDKRRVRQSAKRAAYDTESLYATLDACNIGHVSFVADGWPQSIPTAIARIDDFLYLHGHPKSRLYQALAASERACVSVCRVDGLVKARSAFHCSMNYRSAVVFGCATLVNDDEKPDLLNRFTEHLIPGSIDDYRPFLAKELKGTTLVRLPLTEFSVKIRNGGPVDDEEDLELPHWAGVVPITSAYGEPIAADDLPDGIEPGAKLLRDVKP
jgi:nitroimidazol reductase NimA-like FMN-containing flavoprotein (pyridoxamine 5'-phosphate oxidase superfamily)